MQDGFKTEEATVESDQATAVADAAQNDKAQSDFKRFEELFKTKVVSPQDVDQFRATAKSAQATLNAAEKKVLIDEALVSEARAQVDAFAGLVQSVNAQIHESDANLATAKLNQSYTRILAPESGWVTQKSVEPGAYVQAGQNLFALVPKQVWATANFKEDHESKSKWMRCMPGNFAGLSIVSRPAAELDSVCSLPKMQQVIT